VELKTVFHCDTELQIGSAYAAELKIVLQNSIILFRLLTDRKRIEK